LYENTPATVAGLKWEIMKIDKRDRLFLTWNPIRKRISVITAFTDLQKTEVEILPGWQIASTISNQYIDKSAHNMPKYYDRVVAVDQSGNTSK
jgi:hypothetical protein